MLSYVQAVLRCTVYLLEVLVDPVLGPAPPFLADACLPTLSHPAGKCHFLTWHFPTVLTVWPIRCKAVDGPASAVFRALGWAGLCWAAGAGSVCRQRRAGGQAAMKSQMRPGGAHESNGDEF